MAAELSAATYRMFARIAGDRGNKAQEKSHLAQASVAREAGLPKKGKTLIFNQGKGVVRFEHDPVTATRYRNKHWGINPPNSQGVVAGGKFAPASGGSITQPRKPTVPYSGPVDAPLSLTGHPKTVSVAQASTAPGGRLSYMKGLNAQRKSGALTGKAYWKARQQAARSSR